MTTSPPRTGGCLPKYLSFHEVSSRGYSLLTLAKSPRRYEPKIQSNNSHTLENIEQEYIQQELLKENEEETNLLCRIDSCHFQYNTFQELHELVLAEIGHHLEREHP